MGTVKNKNTNIQRGWQFSDAGIFENVYFADGKFTFSSFVVGGKSIKQKRIEIKQRYSLEGGGGERIICCPWMF